MPLRGLAAIADVTAMGFAPSPPHWIRKIINCYAIMTGATSALTIFVVWWVFGGAVLQLKE